jgi:hypothetical protein
VRKTIGAACAAATTLIFACAKPSQFDRLVAEQDWNDAAKVFASDTALHTNEKALYRAATLFGTPGRSTYDPERARQLFATLLSRFPNTPSRDDAKARMMLLDEVLRMRAESMQHEHDLEVQIAALAGQMQTLKVRADSISASSDSLRITVSRLDADRRDKEAQLQTLRRELQRLKEIDLRPRPSTKP